jgi:hypothetical protein
MVKFAAFREEPGDPRMDKLKELEQQRMKLDAEIERVKQEQKGEALKALATEIVRYEFTMEEITLAVQKAARDARKGTAAAPESGAAAAGTEPRGKKSAKARKSGEQPRTGTAGAQDEGRRRPGRKPASKALVRPKYRDPVSGRTWAGRGLQPVWFKEALSSGKTPSDLLVDKGAAST